MHSFDEVSARSDTAYIATTRWCVDVMTKLRNAMKIILDRPRCEGHGLCEEVAPTLMHLDDAGELVLDVVDVNDDQLDAAKEAVRVCPVAALKLA